MSKDSPARLSVGQVKSIVRSAKRARKNRVYYDASFNFNDLYKSGVIQSEPKAAFDRVTLDRGTGETVHLFGFDQSGSHLDLSLSILPLFPDCENKAEESRWRMAKVAFRYVNSGDGNNNNGYEYSYANEQLIDYEAKRDRPNQHESRNIYKIGSLSLECVLPFSLSRILFNGLLMRKAGDSSELVSAKITISTHPANDKFDYQYKFNVDYLGRTISESLARDHSKLSARNLLELALEDRIDQPLMFQGQLELLDSSDGDLERFIMWGAKVKRVFNGSAMVLARGPQTLGCQQRESLYLWSDAGHQVHLTRPQGQPSLVYGLINSAYDYASYLYDAKLLVASEPKPFGQISSFAELSAGCEIALRGYKIKDYTVKFLARVSGEGKPFRVSINDFRGWGVLSCGDLASELQQAQANLLALDISDERLSFKLSSERLLGGKGNSLVQLSRLVSECSGFDPARLSTRTEANVSVPAGVVVSCTAYHLWLGSSDLVANSLRELDNTRRTLAARSIYLNPLSDRHLTLAQSQKVLRDQCERTSAVLKACSLPEILKRQLRLALEGLFTTEQLEESSDEAKVFAVRSSAVGEDSLETSAAGQMKTFLDVRGFDQICRAVVECWASQFSLEAITYKTENGLHFNLPMAVVVQELVQCRAAGVATTCEPMSGDKGHLELLANPGLGEGVVSGGEADRVRVSLKQLRWDHQLEHPIGGLSLGDVPQCVQKLPANAGSECCLSDGQIVSLANLLLWLRRSSSARDREIEWGITTRPDSAGAQSDSSSSSSSSQVSPQHEHLFHIHLLQSRPLTNLNRLSSREIDHELDYGFSSPLDTVSRANLGEVMPGALCPLNSTFFFPVVTHGRGKPFESNHTRKSFSPDSFGFHGQVILMVLTNSDILSRFPINLRPDDKGYEDTMAVRMMLGTLTEAPKDIEERERLHSERLNPLSTSHQKGLGRILALDLGLLRLHLYATARKTQGCSLTKDLTSLDSFIERLEEEATDSSRTKTLEDVEREIELLFGRLTTRTDYLLSAWETHIRATILSMSFNVMCLKLLASQKAYPEKMRSSELLNDFSILMRNGGEKTESGDISGLLAQLIALSIEEGKLDSAKQMSPKQLHEYLTGSQDKCAQLYREFMRKNGHRTFKEFDMATSTWADDPSYIIKSLAARFKSYSSSDAEKELEKALARERDRELRTSEILNDKVESLQSLLTGYLLPRARNAVVRREQTKSLLIKTIDKYRAAFRHLGGLLCLAGRLPRADLVFQLSIEELDMVVRVGERGGCERADLARIIYKARRRQQRQRVLNGVTFARPVMGFEEMLETVRQVSEADERPGTGVGRSQPNGDCSNATQVPERGSKLVRGITSCAGLVTGRACVVNSLDDMDQIQPNDILITYSIDISWSVYFFTLAGIVTEIGGIVSHGAVVAREYGIPTLCTAFGACSMFKTGQMVTLNANQGVCYLAEESSNSATANDTLIVTES